MPTDTPLIYILAAVACLMAALFYWKDTLLDQLWGNPDLGGVDFQTLAPATKPNQALACPEGKCPNRAPDFIVGKYNFDAISLGESIAMSVMKLPNPPSQIITDNGSTRYIFKSSFWRFPDTLEIKVISKNSKSSTFIALARAKIGYSDFGLNKARVFKIINSLNTIKSSG